MSKLELDLTAAVNAAAQAITNQRYGDFPADALDDDDARAAIAAALPHLLAQIREGIVAEIHDYADSVYDLIDSPNGAQLAFERIEDIARNFGGAE